MSQTDPNTSRHRPCVARVHLRGADFAVYDASMALTAHSEGARILSASRETLAQMTGYGLRTVGLARVRLVKLGWLRPVTKGWQEDQRRTGVNGVFATPRFEVIEHAAWAIMNPGRCTVVGSTDRGQSADGVSDSGSTDDGPATIPSTVARQYRPRSTVPQSLNKKPYGMPSHGVRRTSRDRPSSVGPEKREQKLRAGLVKKIDESHDSLKAFLDEGEQDYVDRYPEWWPNVQRACEFLGYELDENDPATTLSFVQALSYQYEKFEEQIQAGSIVPGIFGTKIIDQLVKNKEFFPPSFTHHRDQLRSEERRAS